MEKLIFTEENKKYSINFTGALWATDLHEIYRSVGNFLSDVDFIAETENEIILVEYKNANIPEARQPERFNPESDKMLDKIARKYYDSMIYILALKKDKPVKYYYILEYPNGDSTTRRLIREKISTRLPFKIPGVYLINKFDVISIEEWNTQINSRFPVTSVF